MTAQETIAALNEIIELTPEQEVQIMSLEQWQLDEIGEYLEIETSPAEVAKWLWKKLREYL